MTQLEHVGPGLGSAAPRARRKGYPAASRNFDLIALALAAWVLLGGYADGIAHVHGATDDSFFTPFHLLLYSGMLAKGIFLAGMQWRNVNRGHHWLQALPRGYLMSLVGIVLMATGGFLDFLWHTAFGIEADIEAAVSPPHLLLAFSALVFMSGPLRALWGRAEAQRGRAQLFPAIASALLVYSIFSLFTQFVHAISWVELFTPGGEPDELLLRDHAMTAKVIFPALLMSAVLLLLLRRWALPFGAVTFLLVTNSALMFLLRSASHGGDNWLVLLAPLVAGLLGDLLLRGLQRPRIAALPLCAFAFLVPFSYHVAFFVILQWTGGIWWSIHMWTGVSVLAGVFGLALSFVAVPPPLPPEGSPAPGREPQDRAGRTGESAWQAPAAARDTARR
ncbi:MAG: hypothetical protein OXF63_03475 [Anaerolineaceae bacterium]|nr:hypothetical protein [Anaerolineaceae bacterium]